MSTKSFDVYQENCPSRKVLEIISDKWTILIIEKLSTQTLRFGELKRAIGGISQKVLTQILRKLEKNGLVYRENFPTLILRVEYSLTDLGKSLSHICRSITQWSEKNIAAILANQEDLSA